MKMWGCEIDDPRITEMDPVRKLWMMNNWIADQNDQAELAKNHAYLLASFSHPEAVKELMGEGNVHESSDEEYEESLRMVKEGTFKLFPETSSKSQEDLNQGKRRRSKIIKG